VNFIWKIDMDDNESDIRKSQEALQRIWDIIVRWLHKKGSLIAVVVLELERRELQMLLQDVL